MISIIAAMDRNGLIGQQNDLPWYIKEDLKHFKNTTKNSNLIMGYNTYLSVGVLDGRKSIVIDKRIESNYHKIGNSLLFVPNFHQAIALLSKFNNSGFVIGGGKTYETAIKSIFVDKMILSRIGSEQKITESDIYFPSVNWNDWELEETNKLTDLVIVEYWKRI